MTSIELKPGETELQYESAKPTNEQAVLVKMSTLPELGAEVTFAAGVVVADTAAGRPPFSTSPMAEQNPSKPAISEYSDAGKAVAANSAHVFTAPSNASGTQEVDE